MRNLKQLLVALPRTLLQFCAQTDLDFGLGQGSGQGFHIFRNSLYFNPRITRTAPACAHLERPAQCRSSHFSVLFFTDDLARSLDPGL